MKVLHAFCKINIDLVIIIVQYYITCHYCSFPLFAVHCFHTNSWQHNFPSVLRHVGVGDSTGLSSVSYSLGTNRERRFPSTIVAEMPRTRSYLHSIEPATISLAQNGELEISARYKFNCQLLATLDLAALHTKSLI